VQPNYRLRRRRATLPIVRPLPLLSIQIFQPRKIPRIFLLTYLTPAFLFVIPLTSVPHRYLLLCGDVLDGDHHKCMGLGNTVYLRNTDVYISFPKKYRPRPVLTHLCVRFAAMVYQSEWPKDEPWLLFPQLARRPFDNRWRSSKHGILRHRAACLLDVAAFVYVTPSLQAE
jgi:hypothetical protein